MKWYVAQLRLEQYKQIADNRQRIFTDYGENRIAFPESELSSMLELCGIREFTEEKTAEENVYFIKPTRYKVYIENVEHAEKLRATLETYSNIFNVDIDFSVPHSHGVAPISTDDKLHIFVYSFPVLPLSSYNKNPLALRRDTLFSYSLPNGARDGFSSTDQGIPITDARGVVAAEVFPRNIFILFDLTRNDEGYDTYLVPLAKIILDQAIPLALKSDNDFEREKKKIVEQKRQEMIERNQNTYVAACKKRIQVECQNIQDILTKNNAHLQNLSTNFIQLSCEQDILIRRLNSLTDYQIDEEKRFVQEYKKLCEAPHIESIDIRENQIIVSTDCISISYKEKTYTIGK